MYIDEVYSKKNIGLAVKVRMGKNSKGETVYTYGRYYGRGYSGESLVTDEDYYILTMVTPSGSLVRSASSYFELIEETDIKILDSFEKIVDKPYDGYLAITEENKFIKTYKYKQYPMRLSDYPQKWFEKKGLLEIDRDTFGKGLSILLSLKFNKKMYYQKLLAKCEAIPGPICMHHIDSMNISIISSVKYDDIYSYYISEYPYLKKDYFHRIFRNFPVNVKKDDYLIYFGDADNSKISLGFINENEFIPTIIVDPFSDNKHQKEVVFDILSYPFISEFIKEIIQYKLNTRNFKITDKDMTIIVNNFINKEDNMLYDDNKTLKKIIG